MCTKCLANSSYVVLPLPRLFHPVRLEAVILVSADHLQLDSRDPGADHRVRVMAFSIYQEKLLHNQWQKHLIAVLQVVPVYYFGTRYCCGFAT